MGLREKVTITLVIIALTQIACRHCMPRTPRKASLKRYLNDLKPVKNNPVPAPFSPPQVNKTPKQTFVKAAQNGRIGQNSLPKKSLFKKYNFPENEYPLDNSPRDPFHIGMKFNEDNHVNTLQKARNLESSAISDLKKEIKMKRKLLSNKQVNYGNSQLKTDMSSIQSASSPDPIRLFDSETFPDVQYPLNTMDTWEPNYWNYLPFTQEKSFHKFGQQTFNPKAKEDINKPLTRLTKAKASKYLQSYDKLKAEHRRTSTENSKRSNVGQKGLNFTKTATCEKVSDDFMTAGLVSNIPSNSTEMKKALTSSVKMTTSSENTCPVTEYSYHPIPIPYKVIEENTVNICPKYELKNNTKELQDVDNSVIAQTLQLIQEILFNDDTSSIVSTGNFSKKIEKSMNTSDYTVVSTNEDISTTLTDSAKSCTVSPTEELSEEVSDDAGVGNLRNNMTSLPAELIPENITTVAGPLNVRMPIPFSEPITYEVLTNALNPGPTPLSNGNAVPASTSIIIIPLNNNGKSQMFGTSPDTPIIVYLPFTESSGNLSQPWPFNQIVSSSIDRPVPNNQLYNVLSNMAPLENDNHFSTALPSEVLNSNSDCGSSLHETLPTNSVSYNNESSPSSLREKPISENVIDKSLTDDAPFVTTSDEKLSEQPTETGDLDVNTDTLPPISDFEHPLFDFSGSDFTSLSHGPYNNMLHNELPIIAREIDSDQQILNVSSKDMFIPEHLYKTTSMDIVSEDSLSEILNDVPPVALDKKFSSVTPTDSIEILKTNMLLHESIPSLPVDSLTESLPQPIDKILLSIPLIEPPTAELPQPKQSSLSPTLLSETLSDQLPIIMDIKAPHTPAPDTTADSAPQHIGNSPSPPILNSSPMMTDMTLKTELYKMRQILDKMLSTETLTYSQPTPIDTTLLPISESASLLLPMNEIPTESLPLPATDRIIDSLQQFHETLPPISVDGSPTDPLPLSGHKLVIPNKLLETGTPSLPIDEIIPPTPVSVSFADNKPNVLDNSITPLSETVTLRTKDTLDNGLSRMIDDLPLKMDLKFPNIYEVSSDDLSLLVDDLPTKVHPEHPGVSTNNLPIQVVDTLTPICKVTPVSDMPKPTDMLSLPVDEVIEGAVPDVPIDSVKILKSGPNIDKLLQDFSSSKVPSDGLPTLPMNEFKLSIHETFPNGQFNEISSESPPQKDYLPQSVQKIIPDLSLADAVTNEPSLKGYLPSLVIDKNIEFPYSTADAKDLPLVVEHLLSPENDVTADSLVTDIPSAILLSTNLEGQQSTNLYKISDEVLSESILSDLPRDNLPLPEDKMLPLTDNKPNDFSLPIDKTPSTSKLPINKAPLENVLSDTTKGVLSSVVAKALPVTQHSLLDKTLHHIDVKSPVSETKDIPLRPLQNIFDNPEHTDNLIENVEFSKKLEDTSTTDHLTELLLLPMDELHKDKPYIPTDDIEYRDKNETQSLHNPTHDLPVPIDKVSLLKDPTKTPSSSKLPITKALLEKILSDINTRSLSVPQSLPVTSPSVLEKTLYYEESPISPFTKDSPLLPVDKTLPKTLLSDHPTDNLPISTEDTLPLPIDKTYSELQSLNIPTELSSSIDDIRPDIPIISMYDKEQDEIENPSSENLTGDPSLELPMEGILSLSKDMPSDLTLPNDKIPSSSKLPITKALLENILSDIKTRRFSEPVAQSLPLTSPSVLEKTLYYVESPISQFTEDSPSLPVDKTQAKTSLFDHPTGNSPISTEDTLPLLIDKMYSELQSLNIPTELSSSIDNIRPDIPNISMYNKKQNESENPSSENLTDDPSAESPMQGILSPSKDTRIDLTLPNDKIPSSSKLPITKALLENVLSDINTRRFSEPVAQSLPLTSPSVLEKTLYYEESPISHFTKDSPLLPVDRTLPKTSLSDHPTDNLPISTEDTLPLPIDKTYSELQSLNIPTELSSSIDDIRPDIPIISMYDKEQDEIENPSSENLTGDPSLELPMEGILSLSKDMPSDLTLPNDKIPSSSKLPITKALLENILSDMNTRRFSEPVAQSLPLTSPSVSEKTLYYVESPISQFTEDSPSLPVDKTLPKTSLSNHPTGNSPISTEDTLPLLIDKMYSELQSLNIPTGLSSSIDNILPDIPNISMYDKKQNESENPSSENLTNNLSSASPMKGILFLSKDMPSDLTLPNNKIPSSSKLPITKALLENILSDINTRRFSEPVAQSLPLTSPSVLEKTLYYEESPISQFTEDSPSLPVDKTLPKTSLSNHSTGNLPISTEDALPLSIDKMYSELQSLNIPTELSSSIDNIRPDIPNISMYDKEEDEVENPSSENLTDDPSSELPMQGILSLSKDMRSDLTLPNDKIPSSSKLPITKALLENILSDINTRRFSEPVAQSLPLTSPSVLEKTLYYVESPISQFTEDSPSLPVDKTQAKTSLFDHPTGNSPISTEDTLALLIDKMYSELQSLNIPTELSSSIDNIRPDIPNISMYDKEQDEIENPSSENRTDDPSSELPMQGILSPSKDTRIDLTLPNDKIPSSSKLPITKALLENVLSDINTRRFSEPVAQSLPLTSPSVLEKTLYYEESPISQFTEDSPSLPVDKTLPKTSLSNHSTGNLPISTEDALPLSIDKMYSESQSLNIPTELSSSIDNIRPDIPNISMYDKEEDEVENPSSENLTDDPSSELPMQGILSLSKDMPSDLTLPNDKIPSSSKLPITKALLENILSDINTRRFSEPVAQSLPLTSPSVLEKTLYYVESPISQFTEDSPSLPVDKTQAKTSLFDHPTGNSPISTEDTLALLIDKMYSELQSLNIPTELSSSIDNIRPDIPNISMYDKEQDEIENPSSENRTDDPSSELPMQGILSPSKDTRIDLTLSNDKIPSSSKLPITKALLENVLSDINTRRFSEPVAQSLPLTSPSVLEKTLYYEESPISQFTEDSPSLPVDKTLPKTSLSNHSTGNLPISTEDALPLSIDKMYSELQSLNIPTELSSSIDNIRPDIPNISMYDKKQNEIENPSSENLTDDPSSELPMEGILSLSKDMPSDLTLPNDKIPSSSKLPITKALLENILSDINTRRFSEPVAQSLPLTSPSVLEKTLYYVESPISQFTEDSPSLPVDKTQAKTSLFDHPTGNSPISTEDTLPLLIDKMYSELQSLNIPTELSSSIDNIRPDIPNISMYDKEEDEIENPSSENLTDDPSSELPMQGILSPSKDTRIDLTLPNDKIPSSSKLPITKALLENVLSDINTRRFSEPGAQSLPLTSPSVSEKTLYYEESPISQFTEDSPSLPVDKTLPETSLSNHSTGNLPISTEDALPLSIDKMYSELQSLNTLTELSSPIHNIRPDIPIISMYDKEQDEIENPSSENLTDDLSSELPMEGILSLSKDMPSDLTLPNDKIPSSSKLPITKALLENILSDINTRRFSEPVAQSLPLTSPSVSEKTLYYEESPISQFTEDSPSLPVDKTLPETSLSNHSTGNLPISTEDALPLSIDKMYSELQSLNTLTELSSPIHNIRPDIPIISMYDKEQDEIENPSSENLTDDPSSELPMKGILSLSKDMPSDLTLPNDKIPSSSKLPITKALLENILSDINTRRFSEPVAQSLPLTSPSVSEKTLYYEESPISQFTEDSPSLPVDKTLPETSLSNHSTGNLPISTEDALPLSIDKMYSELQSLNTLTELSSPIHNIRPDIPIISMYDKEQDEIENPSSENLTDDPSSELPMQGILSLSKDMPSDLTLPNDKIPSSSKLLITKVLLENVLSDINTRRFSEPVAQSLPLTSPSVLEKTLYYVEPPISHFTKDSPLLPVDKTLPKTSLSDHPTDNLPISTEDTLPLPIDKMYSELQSLNIPTELSSSIDNIRPDIPNISMYDKKPNESENPSSENLTDDPSAESPMQGILSLYKDTRSDLTLPNNKKLSSSKLPITKALLENVLSDIYTRGFSLPVAKALPVAPRSELDKTLYFLESPVSDMTEKSSVIPIDNFSPFGINEDDSPRPTDKTLADYPTLDIPTDELLMDKIHNSDILTDDVEDRDKSDNLTENVEDRDTSDNLTDDGGDRDIFDSLTDDIEIEDTNEFLFSDDRIDDIPKDLPLPRTKPYLTSRIPITKVLLEKVLSDITDGGIHP